MVVWVLVGVTALPAEIQEERGEIMRATGAFEVRLSPLELSETAAGTEISRMSIDKEFSGDLAATSRGEMLSGGSPASGSAGYVAIERVTGELLGRNGSFMLQHFATMSSGAQSQTIEVVPGSGTGGLEGLTGTMTIEISGGDHSYEFEFALPADDT